MTFLNNKNKKANESNIWTASLLRLDCIIYRQFNRRLPCDYHMQMSEWENRRESIEKLDVFHIIQINNWNVKVTKMRSSIPCGFHLIWIFKHTKFSHKRKGGGGVGNHHRVFVSFSRVGDFSRFSEFSPHLSTRRMTPGGWHLADVTAREQHPIHHRLRNTNQRLRNEGRWRNPTTVIEWTNQPGCAGANHKWMYYVRRLIDIAPSLRNWKLSSSLTRLTRQIANNQPE